MQRGTLATVRRFNATPSAKAMTAALTSKHHWPVIACDSCDTVVHLDLRVKPRDPKHQSVWRSVTHNALGANGHSRPRIIALARHASI